MGQGDPGGQHQAGLTAAPTFHNSRSANGWCPSVWATDRMTRLFCCSENTSLHSGPAIFWQLSDQQRTSQDARRRLYSRYPIACCDPDPRLRHRNVVWRKVVWPRAQGLFQTSCFVVAYSHGYWSFPLVIWLPMPLPTEVIECAARCLLLAHLYGPAVRCKWDMTAWR